MVIISRLAAAVAGLLHIRIFVRKGDREPTRA